VLVEQWRLAFFFQVSRFMECRYTVQVEESLIDYFLLWTALSGSHSGAALTEKPMIDPDEGSRQSKRARR
jgi:hypothetical protein